MTIQFNTDKNITGNEETAAPLVEFLNNDLARFSKHITRLEVHLSDENGHKEGQDDIRCMIEARLEGRQPLAVTNDADSGELAVKGASDKLKNALETIIGRSRNY
ncbi:HPF/RaiA family ribosome-associated protein [Dyadobacter crusticola]|uniref:HPF/RaiA family ribosome-associated protein n=1 Tax=Dyadobacter crusticola TaxID=292407 RepID=UPI0004E16662|nr:HPF/RaiA family ribosome-associated protein [Dyadobacter crusticola]